MACVVAVVVGVSVAVRVVRVGVSVGISVGVGVGVGCVEPFPLLLLLSLAPLVVMGSVGWMVRMGRCKTMQDIRCRYYITHRYIQGGT